MAESRYGRHLRPVSRYCAEEIQKIYEETNSNRSKDSETNEFPVLTNLYSSVSDLRKCECKIALIHDALITAILAPSTPISRER